MGRRRRGEPVGEDVGTARGFSMVQVKFKDPHVRGDARRVKGYAPRHLHHRTASSSASSGAAAASAGIATTRQVIAARAAAAARKASSASSSSLVRLAPIARDQRACAMLECVATWPRLWLQRATAVGDLSPTAYWSAPAPSSCPFLGLWVPFRPNRRSLPA